MLEGCQAEGTHEVTCALSFMKILVTCHAIHGENVMLIILGKPLLNLVVSNSLCFFEAAYDVTCAITCQVTCEVSCEVTCEVLCAVAGAVTCEVLLNMLVCMYVEALNGTVCRGI